MLMLFCRPSSWSCSIPTTHITVFVNAIYIVQGLSDQVVQTKLKAVRAASFRLSYDPENMPNDLQRSLSATDIVIDKLCRQALTVQEPLDALQ